MVPPWPRPDCLGHDTRKDKRKFEQLLDFSLLSVGVTPNPPARSPSVRRIRKTLSRDLTVSWQNFRPCQAKLRTSRTKMLAHLHPTVQSTDAARNSQICAGRGQYAAPTGGGCHRGPGDPSPPGGHSGRPGDRGDSIGTPAVTQVRTERPPTAARPAGQACPVPEWATPVILGGDQPGEQNPLSSLCVEYKPVR